MDVKRNIFILVAAGLCLFSLPFSASADKCDDVANKASGLFREARDAGKQQDFERAAALYEEAGRYYKQASQMKNCRCPKIEGSSRNNVEICKKNAAASRQALGGSQEVEIHNQATTKFKEGHSYARSQQWDMAASSFDEAEMLWRSIDLVNSKNGQRAHQNADQAREFAERARQQM